MSLCVYGSLIGLEVEKTKLCTQRKDSSYSFKCLDVSFDDIVSWGKFCSLGDVVDVVEVTFAALPSASAIQE